MENFPLNVSSEFGFKAFVNHVNADALEKVDYKSRTAYFKTKEGRGLAEDNFIQHLMRAFKNFDPSFKKHENI